MTDRDSLISLQISTEMKQSLSLVRKVHPVTRSPGWAALGPKGKASFLKKALPSSVNFTRFLPKTPKASHLFARADDSWTSTLVPKVQKRREIYNKQTNKITFFFSPGDTTAAEYYKQNNDQDQKQRERYGKQDDGPGRQWRAWSTA